MSAFYTNCLALYNCSEIRDGSIKPQYVIEQIQEVSGGNGIYVTGVGQHQMWSAQFLRFNEPNSWVTSGGLGTMGFGLPAAIGAKVGRPDKDVWLIDGDGSFSMTLVDLATAATYNKNLHRSKCPPKGGRGQVGRDRIPTAPVPPAPPDSEDRIHRGVAATVERNLWGVQVWVRLPPPRPLPPPKLHEKCPA